MIVSNTAIAKAEQSTEKRFERVSQNRQLLADQQARNITHSDVERRETSIVDKIGDLAARQSGGPGSGCQIPQRRAVAEVSRSCGFSWRKTSASARGHCLECIARSRWLCTIHVR
jgi:hypothetical protein